jgi:PAS domain S-box-containing protein
MENPPVGREVVHTRKLAAQVAVCYAAFGIAWILGAGWLLDRFASESRLLHRVEKWAYLALTVLVLWLVLDRSFRAVRRSVLASREAEADLRLIADNLPIGYVFQYQIGPDGKPRFNYVSRGFEKMHHASCAEVLRDPSCLFDIMDPGQREAYAEAEAKSARDLSDFDMELKGRASGGKERVVRVQAHPLRTPDGQVIWNGFVLDVTEQKRTERLLTLSAEVLRVLNDPDSLQNAAQHILDAIKRDTGIEAVAIRLRQDNDFPYAVSQGFSANFLATENSVVVRSGDGEVCLDEAGNPRVREDRFRQPDIHAGWKCVDERRDCPPRSGSAGPAS